MFVGENDSDFDKLRDSDDINEESSLTSSPVPVKAPLTEPRKNIKKAANSRASLPAPIAIKLKPAKVFYSHLITRHKIINIPFINQSEKKFTTKPILPKKRAATEVNLELDDEDEADIEDETPVTIAPKRKRKSSHGTTVATPAKRANNKTYSTADRFNNSLDNGIGNDYTTTVSSAR